MIHLLALVALAAQQRSRGVGWREALVVAGVYWGALSVGVAEVAGAFFALTPAVMLTFWSMVIVAALVLTWRREKGRATRGPAPMRAIELRWNVIPAAARAVVFIATALAAAWATPDNWDPLTYHLPKVEHWLQNRTLASYPSSLATQISLAPGAEILILHARLLAAGDGYANLVQWITFTGVVVLMPFVGLLVIVACRGDAPAHRRTRRPAERRLDEPQLRCLRNAGRLARCRTQSMCSLPIS